MHGHPVGEHAVLLQPGEEAPGQVAVAREVEGVGARGQLAQLITRGKWYDIWYE